MSSDQIDHKRRWFMKDGVLTRDWSAPAPVFVRSIPTIPENILLDRGWTPELIASRLPPPNEIHTGETSRLGLRIEPQRTWNAEDVNRATAADDMPELLRRGRCIPTKAILRRPKWTPARRSHFLPEPDRIVKLSRNGKFVKVYLFHIGRIEDIENSFEFNQPFRKRKRVDSISR